MSQTLRKETPATPGCVSNCCSWRVPRFSFRFSFQIIFHIFVCVICTHNAFFQKAKGPPWFSDSTSKYFRSFLGRLYRVNDQANILSEIPGIKSSRSKIRCTRYKIQGIRYLVQDIYQSTIYLVRGIRLQGTAVVPGTGTSSLWTNHPEYRRKVVSCWFNNFFEILIWNITWKYNQTAEVLVKSKWV